MALTKKLLNNFLPNGFETQNKEGYKANFTNDRILSGYEKDTLEILSGPNLNNFIDKTGKNFNTLNDLLEYFNEMPIDSFPIVNASNQLDYKSINSFFRNVGELVFSSVPIDDKNLHLADGSLLDGKGTYRVFVDFIGKMATKYPNLFTDEATWQATVSKYGTCGKYVWDAENKTLRLPRLKGIVEATIDQNSIGNITEAGLPNITGKYSAHDMTDNVTVPKTTGCFFATRDGYRDAANGSSGGYSINLDASRSSQVYGKSNTVQPQTVKQYIYIVVSVDTEETTKLTSVFQYRGSVPTFEDLPTEGNITGDVWNVENTNVNYVWDGAEWDSLAGSVDLSGYYTKEECNTRFATVTSLESNVENLQSKITQNTTDIASLGLGDIVASSLEKGKALKYLETKGNITEDADVYNDVYNYKHSSFDINKFTVVGTPTITSDGVASGFSANNFLQIPVIQLGNYDNWEIVTPKFTFSEFLSTNMIIFWAEYSTWFGGIRILRSATNGRFHITLASTSSTDNDIGNIIIDPAPMLNVEYQIKLKFTGTQYIAYLKVGDSDWQQGGTPITTTTKIYNALTTMVIGNYQNNGTWMFKGSMNLTQFSITVDGKEVFNGNKTGLDVLKPDNYTVVGSPVISEDGVVSGFTANNYVTSGTLNATKPFRIEQECFCNGITTTLTAFQISSTTSRFFLVYIKTSGVPEAYDGVNYLYTYYEQKINFNKKFKLILVSDGTNLMLGWEQDGVEHFDETRKRPISAFTAWIPVENAFVKIGTGTYLTKWVVGSIDLNSFKIYVDGKLVYQPCLKIPYNISKTGLKVANADARERIIGMAEDYGYSQYFTIDEENKNATLPLGAGITGRQDLIASFDDGTNKYEQFSDLTFKQSGKCTANTAVTFIQPYKDDTYKLSVPYSAKTKTGFTPTVNGDWFAEGKIYLD